MSGKVYDVLKFVALILLPAIGALYFAIAGIWGLPYAQEIVGTITSIDAFLGVLLGINTRTYNASDAKYDGAINVITQGENKTFSLEFKDDEALDSLDQKPSVMFKINAT
jgi:hypothetical protein